MPGKNLEKRVAELEKQVGALLAGGERAKDWRRTRGAFTGNAMRTGRFRRIIPSGSSLA